MRRLRQTETLHGTRHGQLPFADELRSAYSLTDREGAVAALLAQGMTASLIAGRLGIAGSTSEKHVASLRRKLGVASTTEAAALLARFTAERAKEIPAWPPSPSPDGPSLSNEDRRLSENLRSAGDLASAIHVLRDHLAPEGVRAIYFAFLPMNVASFRRGQAIEEWAAPEELVRAFREAGGLTASPIAARLFGEPDTHVVIHGTDPDRIERELGLVLPVPLLRACERSGLGHSVAFGSPFGCGFVGASIFFDRDPRGTDGTELEERIRRLRADLLLTQSTLYAHGVLARTLDLTLRERDALSLLAQGLDQAGLARELGCGERSVSKILKGARDKLRADTNTEAVSRAMAVNALVFL